MALPVNDTHGHINPTSVARIARPTSLDSVRKLLADARKKNLSVCLAGGRHAMGGQQFATDGLLIDHRRLKRVLDFSSDNGTITVQAGIQWPELVQWLLDHQKDSSSSWGIRQKQTGADRMTIAGSLSANTHGRGLTMPPLVADVLSFTMMDAEGNLHRCGRGENQELFSLVIGGYGLFGIIIDVTLQLVPRRQLERIVQVIPIQELMDSFNKRIADGFLFGDFQFHTDERSEDFLRRGVFSCYRPVDDVQEISVHQKRLSRRMWHELLYVAHFDKSRAFQVYADYYLSTNGQRYWSDTHQLASYIDDYHKEIDRRRRSADPASEVITEIFVPRDRLIDFLEEARADFLDNAVNVIYGTIRLVERDTETVLPWARQSYVGIIFNLHTVHTPEGIDHSARAFRRLIDMGIVRGGSYYLTYHRFATRQQVETCYPRFAEFLERKSYYDSQELFQSDWYRHYKKLFIPTEEN